MHIYRGQNKVKLTIVTIGNYRNYRGQNKVKLFVMKPAGAGSLKRIICHQVYRSTC
jgi:hypothetical protein